MLSIIYYTSGQEFLKQERCENLANIVLVLRLMSLIPTRNMNIPTIPKGGIWKAPRVTRSNHIPNKGKQRMFTSGLELRVIRKTRTRASREDCHRLATSCGQMRSRAQRAAQSADQTVEATIPRIAHTSKSQPPLQFPFLQASGLIPQGQARVQVRLHQRSIDPLPCHIRLGKLHP